MIQEILEFYFDKKLTDTMNDIVSKKQLDDAMSRKLDRDIFAHFERSLLSDRTQQDLNHKYDEKLLQLERNFANYVTIAQNDMAMQDKANLNQIEELSERLSKVSTLTSTNEEKASQSV